MSIGTSNSVQTAIHFLYGKIPKITLDNVEDLLEVAEFLMIEELKAMCITKLKNIRINENNCIKVLMLASRYDFYLENVYNFIRANLAELLRKDELLLLDRESVRFILTDPLLAYVSREDCFRFLIKWIGHCKGRKSFFVELFTCLDKDDLSAEVLSTVDLDCLSETDKSLCNNFSSGSNRWCDMLAVYPPVFMSGKYHISGKYHLYVYNLKKKLWYEIPIDDKDYRSSNVCTSLIGTNTLVNCNSWNQTIRFYNLASQTGIEKKIEMASRAEIPDVKHISASGEKIYFVGKVKNKYSFNTVRRSYRRMDTSCLYISEKVDDSFLTMKELISIRGTVQSMCVADGTVCILIPESKHIIVYSDEELLLTKFDLFDYQLDQESYLCPRSRGGIFVVTKCKVLQLGIHVNCSDITVCMSDSLAQAEAESGDRWVRLYPPVYEFLQDKIITIKRCRDRQERQFWYQPLPEKISFLNKEEKFEIDIPEQLKNNSSNIHFVQFTLPKEKTLCPIDCPHCETRYSCDDRDFYEPDYDSDCVYYEGTDDYDNFDVDIENDYYTHVYNDYYFDSD